MSDKSDYNLPRTKMHELLPAALDSDVNTAVFENLFNRFLTKNETRKTAGYVGEGNNNALVSRQIHEPTVARQANQLQPVLHNKVGSIDHMASWQDILNELERLGVQIDKLPEWGQTTVFNWVPPIDVDKIVNYSDYFWVDNDNNAPEYITVKNRCQVLTDRLSVYQRMIDNNKAVYPITGINTAPVGSTNTYNRLIVDGNYTSVFETGFVFRYRNNPDPQPGGHPLNGDDQTVVSSVFNTQLNQTTITIENGFDSAYAGGVISLTEELAARTTAVAEQCSTPKGPSGKEPTVLGLNQWIVANKWQHRTTVANFSTAKQAELPIIEYDDNLELNEWTKTEHEWKYRSSTAKPFKIHAKPTLIELIPLQYTASGSTVTLIESCGDQTNVFVPGSTFETQNNQIVQVVSSRYVQPIVTKPYQTVIQLDTMLPPVSTTGYIVPVATSVGDSWAGYNQHWVYSKQLTPVAAPHPTPNPFLDYPLTGTGTDTTRKYQYQGSPYVMTFTMVNSTNALSIPSAGQEDTTLRLFRTTQSGWNLPQADRAIIGNETTRVYINGQRQFGTYTELDEATAYAPENGTDTRYVAGIIVHPRIFRGDVIRVEVGPAAFSDVGLEHVEVRTVESDITYAAGPAAGTTEVSLVEYRRVEQEKTVSNQYPLFDVYNSDGTPTYTANSLFEFVTGADYVVDTNIQLRVATNTARTEFSFNQLLLGTSDEILAYKSYDNSNALYWVDHDKSEVWFWNRFGWTVDGEQGIEYGPATISSITPTTQFQGKVWYDSTNRQLKHFDGANGWQVLPQVAYQSSNPYLQTVWRKGLNDEKYIPKKVDWKGRTLAEYNTERDTFMASYTPSASALTAWYSTQINELSLDGVWIGDWDIPDPLYYNTQHENRKTLSLVDLNEHFGTIKTSQPREPGVGGGAGSKFHTLRSEDVNYGLGGTIHEYGKSFDTLLSSAFVNNVTPLTLFEFARDQYEILLNSLRENYRDELASLMLNTDADNTTNFSGVMTNLILDQFTQNDANSNLYGDSSTFVDNAGVNDVGMQNWIATLPFFHILPRVNPEYLVDAARGINEIVHHDGHRRTYKLTETTKDAIARRVINSIDARSTQAAPNNKLGKLSSTSPSDTVADFLADFGESINNRRGVYWYEVSGSKRILYRLAVAAAGQNEPAISLPDGALWIDTTPGAMNLRQKSGFSWPIVSGVGTNTGRLHNGTNASETSTSTVSAWQVFDLDEFLADLVYEAEQRLFSAAPTSFVPVFDFDSLTQTPADAARYAVLQEQAFLDYTRQSEIAAPLENVSYVATDAFSWNYKHSAPGLRFDIVSSSAVMGTMTLAGEVASDFTSLPNQEVFIKNTGVNDGTYHVASVVEVGGQTIAYINETIGDSLAGIMFSAELPKATGNTGAESAGDWRSLYLQYYGTPYPHLEPWKLQEYTDKPTWWDTEYKDTTGTRRWTPAMWVELAAGRIPNLKLLPDGITPSGNINGETTQYNYFSVNTTTDELLPPYFGGGSGVNRSIFTNMAEIVAPAASYAFGDNGPVETDWKLSSQYLYDQLDVAYQMQPLKVMDSLFGFDKIEIAGLPIDTRTKQVPAHNRTKFHGEILSDGNIIDARGFNQWYVNYNRYQGFDASLADFRRLWTGWTAPLTYQFATFVDTGSFQLGHRTVPMSSFDYKILSKRSPGVEDFWLNAFDITVLSVPPKLNRLNNEHDWRLQLNINTPLTQAIDYYDVRNYPFSVDVTTDTCELYAYDIANVDYFNTTISVQSDQTVVFKFGRSLEISNSVGNDGTYTVQSSIYDASTKTTIVSLSEPLMSPITSGKVTATYRSIPWETGDPLFFTTEDVLPTPLISDQPNIGPIIYFIIKVSDTTFKVANTRANALSGLEINLSSVGRGIHHVGEIQSTFYALDSVYTSEYWRHYALDMNNKLTITPPTTIHGMQELVNIVDGYAVVVKEAGFSVNERNNVSDPETGRVVDWQVEVERFIDFAYSLQGRRDTTINNRFEATADQATDVWTWGDYTPNWTTGKEVHVLSSTGNLPIPILHGIRYYLIADSDTNFRLAHSRRDAIAGIPVDMQGTPAGSTLMIYAALAKRSSYPSQEINPFRNNIFFSPSRGIVSNMVTGPAEDIRNTQLLFDQYGEPLDRAHTRIYRQDEQTFIQCAQEIKNPNIPTLLFTDPYSYLHLGGAHIFIDSYEHVLVFNNETTEGALLYDPFIGLNVTKFELLFNRQVEFTERPNVGGSYYSTYFNQGASLVDNFEASVENIRYLYDAYQAIESKALTIQSRTSLGYEGTQDYLADLNLNQKSQFIFWRGLIQNKGAVESVQAFINSRRFIDANVDEFWAYKLADFGSSEDKEYPEMYITTENIRSNDFRIQFTETGEVIPGFGNGGFSDIGAGFDITGEEIELEDDGITLISLTDTDRWYNQPDIVSTLRDNGSSLYFALRVVNSVDIAGITDVKYQHNFNSDYEVVTLEPVMVGTVLTYNHTLLSPDSTTIQLPSGYTYLPGTGQIQVTKNGAVMNNPVDYIQTASPGSTGFFSDNIAFTTPLVNGDVVKIIYNAATLTPETHFDRINSNIIRFKDAGLIDPSFNAILWAYRVDEKAQNPARLVDRVSNTIVTDVPLWDPARGVHYKQADSIISLRRDTDPAIYGETLQTQGTSGKNATPWNRTETGRVWLDTSKLGYIPYHDDNVFQTLDDRLKYWGQLADWSEITLYEWVESDLLPEDYNEAAIEEEGDSEIAEHIRKSGRARETLFELVNDEWVILDDKAQEFSVLFDGTQTQNGPDSYNFVLDANILGIDTEQDADVQYVSVYVNGLARISPDGIGFEIPQNLTMEVSGLGIADTLRFIKYAPSEDVITTGIEAGTLARRFEYTAVPYVDNIGQLQNRYYFWVSDKVTKNLKQPMSILTAQNQLTTIPTPYIVTGNTAPADIRASALVDLDKSWSYLIGANETDAVADSYQITDQTEADYATFTGGESDPLKAFHVGDIIILTNNQQLLVEAVDPLDGNVLEFTVLLTENALPTVAGMLSMHPTNPIIKINGTSGTTGSGFTITLAANNVNATTHDITLGSPIKNKGVVTTLKSTSGVVGQSHDAPTALEITNDTVNPLTAPYYDKFIGGDGATTTSYAPLPRTITLNNNTVITVDSVHATTGDVVDFTISNIGDPFLVGEDLTEAFSTPAATNNGFTLFPDATNVDVAIDTSLFNVWVDGRQLIPYVEYTIDSTGRVITILQSVGAIEGKTVKTAFTTVVAEETYDIPARMTDIVLRGLRRYVNEDRRYTIRFTRDFTLRDDIDVTLKSKHTEWILLRQGQATKIPLSLWNRMIEAMAGYKLSDPSEAVPELARVLYDETYGTDTQYGLGDGQAFTNGQQAITTMMLEMFNEDIQLNNIDLNVFFDLHNFDTPEAVVSAATEVYNSFATEDVNRLFFTVMHDAFANKKRYAELFKTSMIAVHGIRPFQVSGLFDD